jgi:hypothetical protein
MYRWHILCIPIQSSILQYCDICVSVVETRSDCTTQAKIPKKKNSGFYFRDQSWIRVGFCMTLQKTSNLPGFLGSGFCYPSDIAGEPFCIQEFCFVTYQLIWSYSQKPLTFSSFTTSNTHYVSLHSIVYMFDFD